MPEEYYKYIFTLLVVIITLVLTFIYKRSRLQIKNILLLGLTGSGKTNIFSWLLHQKQPLTYTSIKENSGEYINQKDHHLNIVDIPGHESITYHLIGKYSSMINGVIFVIDSYEFPKNYKDVANYLFCVLSDYIPKNIPIMIVCTKQDLPLAKNAIAIKTIIEKEFELLKLTKANLPDAKNKISKEAKDSFLNKNLKNVNYIESEKADYGELHIKAWLNKF